MRKKCGGKMPRVNGWAAYVKEYQWRNWFGGPVVPLLIDLGRELSHDTLNQQRLDEEDMAMAYWAAHPRGVIDLDTSDSEAGPPAPPRPMIVLDTQFDDVYPEEESDDPMSISGGYGDA